MIIYNKSWQSSNASRFSAAKRSGSLVNSKRGTGFLNTLINKLPFELHLPGYNYCGPGTKLIKRLQRGDRGVNPLDEACKEHDIAYHKNKELGDRHIADSKLHDEALKRIRDDNASFGEKVASTAVAALMKGKTALGMGTKRKNKNLAQMLKRLRNINRKKKNDSSRKRGGFLSFPMAIKLARMYIQRHVAKSGEGLLGNVKAAQAALSKKRVMKPRNRIIPIPKTGGILPLIPIFAALSAIGALSGGAAGIAKSVNDAKAAKETLKEQQRHNKVMEAKSIGQGLYIQSHKGGCGIDISGSKNY